MAFFVFTQRLSINFTLISLQIIGEKFQKQSSCSYSLTSFSFPSQFPLYSAKPVTCKVFVIISYWDINRYKMKDPQNFIITGNSECSCFGSLKKNQDQFLSKYNAFTHPQKNIQLNHIQSQQGLAKFNTKKSLKKPFVPLFLQNSQRLINKNKQKLPRVRSLKKAVSSQGKKKEFFNNSLIYQHTPISISSHTKQQPYKNISFNTNNYQPIYTYSNQQIQIRPVSSTQPSPKYKYPLCQFSTPIKISYKDPNIAQNKWNSQPSKKQEIFSSNQLQKQQIIVNNINKQQQSSSVRVVKQQFTHIILSKSQSFKIPPSQVPLQLTNDLNVQKCESSILSNSIQINIAEVNAQNEPLKFSWDKQNDPQTTNTLSVFKSQQLNINSLISKQPSSIKKMDDVMQICSQADSQQDKNSDKQSIVLGRLNQYSSMLQQKHKVETISSLIDKKVQNRLAKIGSLNSTIGHCQSMRQVKH